MKRSTAILLCLTYAILCQFACAPALRPKPSAATLAERFADEGKLDEAIASYRKHIELRLQDPKRPKSENPYFYLLFIGDLYLQSEQITLARKSYEEARAKGVDGPLVAERLRSFATYFEKKDDLERAILELKRYRELDPLMFDSEIDRLHKLFVAREREKESNSE
jgi:tetratricopeptide (TPR) repeat protein